MNYAKEHSVIVSLWFGKEMTGIPTTNWENEF